MHSIGFYTYFLCGPGQASCLCDYHKKDSQSYSNRVRQCAVGSSLEDTRQSSTHQVLQSINHFRCISNAHSPDSLLLVLTSRLRGRIGQSPHISLETSHSCGHRNTEAFLLFLPVLFLACIALCRKTSNSRKAL